MIHAPPSPAQFAVGDRVRCRDTGNEWRFGTVTHVMGPKVLPDGWDKGQYEHGFKWDEVQPARPESLPFWV
eukprot:gene10136-biopygen12792